MARGATVLLTGFRPFPTQPINVTQIYAPVLARLAERTFPDLTVHAVVLPTAWHAAPAHLHDVLQDIRPALSLHFGIAGRARGFEIETRGINRRVDLDDADGRPPPGRIIDHHGPQTRRAELPFSDILARLRRRGIPVRPSRDAGGYICNALLYDGLGFAAPLGCRLGFVHLPAELAPDGHRRNGVQWTSPLTWPQALVGGLEIIAAGLRRPLPARIALPRGRLTP